MLMPVGVPAVQLENDAAIQYQLLVVRATVAAPTSEQSPVPAAACLDIGDGDERLGIHGFSCGRWHARLKAGLGTAPANGVSQSGTLQMTPRSRTLGPVAAIRDQDLTGHP